MFSAITEAELIAGKYCDNSANKEKTLNFLGNFTKVIIENRVSTLAGDLKRKYGVDLPDALIAASALVWRQAGDAQYPVIQQLSQEAAQRHGKKAK